MNTSALSNYLRDSRVSTWRKLLGLGAVAYTVMPLDAIPDVIPFLGWMDDIGILAAAAAFLWRDVRKHSEALLIRAR